MRKYQISKGFTLIELLTVISIIGILTAFLTVSFISVRQRARDAQRKSDVKQLQSALELYRADNDSYPLSTTFNTDWTCGNPVTSGGVTYMSKMPCDPSSSNTLKYNYSQTSATSYVIGSCLENTNDKDGVGARPSWWTGAACNPAYYYLSQNP